MQGNLPLVLGAVGTGWLLSAGLLWKNRRLGLAVAAFLGVAISFYLGWQHLDAAGSSICSINEVFDCDKVNRSDWSEIFGVPIALVGTAFYASVLAVSVMGLAKPDSYRRAGSLVLVGGILAVGYSAFLAWASVQLGAWCLFCISLYAVNLLILVGGWLSRDPQGLAAALADKVDRSVSTLVTTGLVVFVVVMAWFNMQRGGAVADVASAAAGGGTDAYAQLMEQPGGTVQLDGTEPLLGDPAASYTILEYADFQCPACAAVTPLVHDVVARNPNINVMYKNYPLSNLCNSAMTRAFHQDSCAAATAGECARQQDHFWDLAHLMFKNQSDLDTDGLRFMAKQVGMDLNAFDRCVADPKSLDAVRADADAGNALGITGTPTLYLKGIAGDDWVMMTAGPEGAELLVKAHAAGKTLPAAPAPKPAAGH